MGRDEQWMGRDEPESKLAFQVFLSLSDLYMLTLRNSKAIPLKRFYMMLGQKNLKTRKWSIWEKTIF